LFFLLDVEVFCYDNKDPLLQKNGATKPKISVSKGEQHYTPKPSVKSLAITAK